MPNAYLISSTYRDRPDPGKDPSATVNENVSLNQAVASLVTQINRQHVAPGSVDKLVIAAENKKGHIMVGSGITVSTAKQLAPVAGFLKPGAERVGVEMNGFKIDSEVANRDLLRAIAEALKVSVEAEGETFAPKKA